MVVRIKVVLEKEEYSALVKLALIEMRNPEEQARFMLIQYLKRRELQSKKAISFFKKESQENKAQS